MVKKKQGKNVAGMAVLQDIRSLLSSAGSQQEAGQERKGEELENRDEIQRLEGQLGQIREQLKREHDAFLKSEAEKQELEKKLNDRQQVAKPAATSKDMNTREIADLQAKKDELETALSRIEDLLQIKTKDLIKRLSRVYEEAGDFDAGRDFRRISNQLESSEAFGAFLNGLVKW